MFGICTGDEHVLPSELPKGCALGLLFSRPGLFQRAPQGRASENAEPLFKQEVQVSSRTRKEGLHVGILLC